MRYDMLTSFVRYQDNSDNSWALLAKSKMGLFRYKISGQWFGVELLKENNKLFYNSEGFEHGFFVTSEVTKFCYKVTDF